MAGKKSSHHDTHTVEVNVFQPQSMSLPFKTSCETHIDNLNLFILDKRKCGKVCLLALWLRSQMKKLISQQSVKREGLTQSSFFDFCGYSNGLYLCFKQGDLRNTRNSLFVTKFYIVKKEGILMSVCMRQVKPNQTILFWFCENL